MSVVVRYGEMHPEQTRRYLWLVALDPLSEAWSSLRNDN